MECGEAILKELVLGLKYNLIKIIKFQNLNIKIEKIKQVETNRYNLNLKIIRF